MTHQSIENEAIEYEYGLYYYMDGKWWMVLDTDEAGDTIGAETGIPWVLH
jgi:hypothetical protein